MNDRGEFVSADVGDRSSSDRSTTTTEFPGTPAATVHFRIVGVFSADAIEKKLEQISRTLQKAGASDVSIAVSISPEGFRPTATDRTNANWMAPSRGADD